MSRRKEHVACIDCGKDRDTYVNKDGIPLWPRCRLCAWKFNAKNRSGSKRRIKELETQVRNLTATLMGVK